MATEWGLVQVILAFVLLPFLAQNLWIDLLKKGVKWIRLRLQPELGKCERLLWNDIPDGPLHLCRPNCLHGYATHHPSTSCWKDVFCKIFNVRQRRFLVPKPNGLPLDRDFLCVDREMLLAFIFCSFTLEWTSVDVNFSRLSMFYSNQRAKISPHRDRKSHKLLLHLKGGLNLNLTKGEVDCLMKGYPPFYRETIYCGIYQIASPIRNRDDVARGGWVIGVGLSGGHSLGFEKLQPTAVYWDNVEYCNHRTGTVRRGGVFWRSFDRVLDILENNINKIFPTDADVQAVMDAIAYMIRTESQSGVEACFNESKIPSEATIASLNRSECILAMNIFNRSPNIPENELLALKAEIEPILRPMTAAAYFGVRHCIAYLKNSGRELNRILPQLLMDEELIYLEGCL